MDWFLLCLCMYSALELYTQLGPVSVIQVYVIDKGAWEWNTGWERKNRVVAGVVQRRAVLGGDGKAGGWSTCQNREAQHTGEEGPVTLVECSEQI